MVNSKTFGLKNPLIRYTENSRRFSENILNTFCGKNAERFAVKAGVL